MATGFRGRFRVSWQRRKGETMNLTLGLSDGTRLSQGGGIETSVARFKKWMADPDSPIRAIRHQPAREGEYADLPAQVGPVLRQALSTRGFLRLYTHQAEAFCLS